MLFWCVFLLVIDVYGRDFYEGMTPTYLENVEYLDGVAEFGDAHHRGHKWYDYESSKDDSTDSNLKSDVADSSKSSISTSSVSSSSTEASSAETAERKIATQNFRTCTSCPRDMLKGHNNIGIKWICAGYQRARRSFKSECMMRYRNCQDGTMFVKMYDHRCKNDTYHGKHWFYIYRV